VVDTEVIIFTVLLFIATVRALTTAISRTYDYEMDGEDEYERLVFLEDAEHWWTAVLINAVLLSVGIVALLAPPPPAEVEQVWQNANLSWHYSYSTVVSLVIAVLLNFRIERHGYYFRKRNGINVLGRPRGDGLWTSFKGIFKR
jgi:hypothetical protein